MHWGAGFFQREWKVLVLRQLQHQREMFVVRRESMLPLLCLWWNALAISLESVRLSLYVVCITKDLIEWYFKRTISNCSTFQIATPKLQETCQELSLNKGTAGELRKYLLDRTKLCLEIESAHNLVFIEILVGSLWIPWETWLPCAGQGQVGGEREPSLPTSKVMKGRGGRANAPWTWPCGRIMPLQFRCVPVSQSLSVSFSVWCGPLIKSFCSAYTMGPITSYASSPLPYRFSCHLAF